VLVAVIVAACSQAAPPAQQPQATQSGGEQGGASGGETGATGSLTYWMSGDPALDAATDEILAAYMEAHPGVQVTRESYPFGEYFQKLLTGMAGGSGPDVFWVDVQTASFASRGSVTPAADFVTDEYLEPITPSALREGTWNDTLYAVPLHQIAEAIFINKQMAEEAGIRLPTSVEDAWTWDEFVEIAKQLTVVEGGQTKVWGFAQQRHLGDWSTLPIIHQNGGEVLSPDLKTATGYLNSPKTVEAMQWFQYLFQVHKVISPDVVPEGFPTGQVAMIQAPSSYAAALERTYPDFEYVVVPFFRGPEGCAVMTGGWNVGISAAAENPEMAWDLVDWVTREQHAEWVEKSGYLPIRADVMEQPQFDEAPWNIFMESMTECGVSRPATEHYQFFYDTMIAAIKDIALGGDVQQILDSAAAKLDEQLGK
jgi:ABC-type glycerol-3-phosphate transport system substrate-binding protein